MGIVVALQAHLPHWLGQVLRVYVGLTGALVLLGRDDDLDLRASAASPTRSASTASCRRSSAASTGGRSCRRRRSIAAGVDRDRCCSSAPRSRTSVTFLASLFSFGVLLAFTAAQLAVIRLRMTKPELRRPFRVPLGIRVRGVAIPLPSIFGALCTAAIFVIAMVTHAGARYGGPAWLARGPRRLRARAPRPRRGPDAARRVRRRAGAPAEAAFSRILVPMKLGEIGEEMVATAVRLAQDDGATVEALYVIKVPLDMPLDAEMFDAEEQAAASLAEARALGADNGVEVNGRTVRARSIGDAIVDGGRRERGGPDRPRLRAALASPVALLLADRRLRPAQVAGRGPDRRLPAGRRSKD